MAAGGLTIMVSSRSHSRRKPARQRDRHPSFQFGGGWLRGALGGGAAFELFVLEFLHPPHAGERSGLTARPGKVRTPDRIGVRRIAIAVDHRVQLLIFVGTVIGGVLLALIVGGG
jgi:hypothetical protein